MRRPDFARRRGLLALALAAATPAPRAALPATTIRVGRFGQVATIAAAAARVRDGDTVEIEARDYVGDVAVWDRNDITIRGIGGRPRLISHDAAEDKGTWVIRGRNVVVENIEFRDAVDSYGDGVGIRQVAGTLTVRNCAFLHNQIGLMTANHDSLQLTLEGCEFAHNRSEERISHQLYVGSIGRFEARDCWFHAGFKGHLLKSRARESRVFYNRIVDGAGGESSYELEFPNGGVAYVVGNVIGQSEDTQNPTMISFGAEKYRWPRNELYLVNNTLVNDLGRGLFLKVYAGADRVLAVNNLLVGEGGVDTAGSPAELRDFRAERADLADLAHEDYRLRASSRFVGEATDPGAANGIALRPAREPAQPLSSVELHDARLSPGAMQTLAD